MYDIQKKSRGGWIFLALRAGEQVAIKEAKALKAKHPQNRYRVVRIGQKGIVFDTGSSK